MENKRITVIGATGNLGAPVVKNLLCFGYAVKAIARNVDKAKHIFGNEKNIEIEHADLHNVDSLQNALKGTEFLYLSLSTNTIKRNEPFLAEREGIANILKAIDRGNIKQILLISGLGAFENVHAPNGFEFIPNIIRKEGHKLLKNSGIPYTILHCTSFLDNFVIYRRKGAYSIIGNPEYPIYFTNCYDYSVHLDQAIANPEAMHREFPVQGKYAVNHKEAASRFYAHYDPSVKVKLLPLPVLKILSLFVKELKFVKHMAEYFSIAPEVYLAEDNDLYKVLGSSSTTIEAYAEKLKSENFYRYLH